MQNITISIACDHAGFILKQMIANHLKNLGYKVNDHGCFSEDAVDYPDYAKKACEEIKKEVKSIGILICRSGVGMSIAANRFKHIRAALCANSLMARLAREHNDANMLVLGARFTSEAIAIECVNEFLVAEFKGGKHQRRVDKL